MRTLIAVPCMERVHTLFMTSLLSLEKPDGTEVAVSDSSLVYEARNILAHKAIMDGFDRVLWIDSDMRFDHDLLIRLGKHLDDGKEMVCGLYFTRKAPHRPCIYKVLGQRKEGEGVIPVADSFTDYPKDSVFEVQGCGFGAVLMTVDLIKRVGALPFWPLEGFGEDFSFCLRARQQSAKIWCDSSVKVDHLGMLIIKESTR